MAETTTHTEWPARWVSTMRRATRLMASASDTDEPPYFWTTMLTLGSRGYDTYGRTIVRKPVGQLRGGHRP